MQTPPSPNCSFCCTAYRYTGLRTGTRAGVPVPSQMGTGTRPLPAPTRGSAKPFALRGTGTRPRAYRYALPCPRNPSLGQSSTIEVYRYAPLGYRYAATARANLRLRTTLLTRGVPVPNFGVPVHSHCPRNPSLRHSANTAGYRYQVTGYRYTDPKSARIHSKSRQCTFWLPGTRSPFRLRTLVSFANVRVFTRGFQYITIEVISGA